MFVSDKPHYFLVNLFKVGVDSSGDKVHIAHLVSSVLVTCEYIENNKEKCFNVCVWHPSKT